MVRRFPEVAPGQTLSERLDDFVRDYPEARRSIEYFSRADMSFGTGTGRTTVVLSRLKGWEDALPKDCTPEGVLTLLRVREWHYMLGQRLAPKGEMVRIVYKQAKDPEHFCRIWDIDCAAPLDPDGAGVQLLQACLNANQEEVIPMPPPLEATGS